jgi:hypothetical protein
MEKNIVSRDQECGRAFGADRVPKKEIRSRWRWWYSVNFDRKRFSQAFSDLTDC